tara:strand:+ start:347 stop:1420 length:1074 start_codon:yes stop_codon:yes gene_type:complete
VLRLAGTLALGATGGYLLYKLRTPLPWMLGSMLFVTVAALLKAPIGFSMPLRMCMAIVLGTFLGSAFSPEILDRLSDWAGGVAVMIVFVAVATTISVAFFVKYGRLDRITAFFSGTPGGLGAMAIIGEQEGGDPKVIPLVHTVRIFVVVFAIPFYLLIVEHLEVPRGNMTMSSRPDADLLELLILGVCATAGFGIAKLIRLPGAQIVGPMILSAIVYLADGVQGAPPGALIAMAQIVIGAGIGARFHGVNVRELLRPLLLGLSSGILMMAAAILIAVVMGPYLGLSSHALILALAPGGVAEMSLIALALDVDTAFIATMHIVRIVLIVSLAPLIFRLLGWSRVAPVAPASERPEPPG